MEFLLIILIIVVVFVYYKLNGRIQKLEHEIFELNKKIVNKNEDSNEIQNIKSISTPTEVLHEAYHPQEENAKLPEQIRSNPQEDWFSPVTDFLKQNALTIIGIFTLVLGIGYFVKYAIDKNWIGETARMAIGFCTGLGIMATAHFLRKNYTVFSSIITGGGIAVLYFTTTIAFREYHVFTQNGAFFTTCFITIISVALSYYYKSEVLIIFSLFGGFLAPLMISTGQSNYLFLFTYLTVLNIGMLLIAFLKSWKSIGWIAFIFTSAYLFYWIIEKTQTLTIYFYIVTYIIFYAFALQNFIKKKLLSSLDILMLVLINFTSIIGLVYIFNELKYGSVIIIPGIFAIINSCLLFWEYGRKNLGINYSVFAGITISLITIAFALQFKTHLITSVWAIEATLLLFIWKKTNLGIFKICFYVLFPLVIVAQMVTWWEYTYSKNLPIIINPVFLTSSVTVITTFVNLILLRKLPQTNKRDNSFFENVFTIVSYAVIYFALLLEIIYHIAGQPEEIIFSIGILFTIFYLFILLVLRNKLETHKIVETGLIYFFLALAVTNASFSGQNIVNSILIKQIDSNFYCIHALYWIPFVYSCWKILPETNFFENKFSYWAISFAIIANVSFELYNLYILSFSDNIGHSYTLGEHFRILHLPIIWAILACIFIYTGLKKNIPELNKAGFALIGIMIIKLYAFDVWKMDNISRIVAFIILGIILLMSSFMFQRLRLIIKNLVDKKEENMEDEKLESS